MSTSFSFPQITKLVDTLTEQGVTPDLLQDHLLGEGIIANVAQAVVAGTMPACDQFCVLIGLSSIMKPASIVPPDIRVHVDRSIRPIYPDWTYPKWVNEKTFIALEATGPSDYMLSSLELWLHEEQKTGVIQGKRLYEYLKSNNMLSSCLGLADLLAIQKLGIKVFRRYFKDKTVFGWRSVVRNLDGDLSAPCLVESGGLVALIWSWLGHDWVALDPAPRFAK